MPPYFGGTAPAAPDFAVRNRDATAMAFTCTTDEEMLAQFVPECFEILRPEVVYTFGQLREIDWLAGGRYNVVTADVPVRFNGKRDRLEGNLNLVTWENLATPIIGGREENGVPKIYAEIQDLHAGAAGYLGAPDYFTRASYDGNTSVRMEMRDAKPVAGGGARGAEGRDDHRQPLQLALHPERQRPGSGAEPADPLPPGCRSHKRLDGDGLDRVDQACAVAEPDAAPHRQRARGPARPGDGSRHADEEHRRPETEPGAGAGIGAHGAAGPGMIARHQFPDTEKRNE